MGASLSAEVDALVREKVDKKYHAAVRTGLAAMKGRKLEEVTGLMRGEALVDVDGKGVTDADMAVIAIIMRRNTGTKTL